MLWGEYTILLKVRVTSELRPSVQKLEPDLRSSTKFHFLNLQDMDVFAIATQEFLGSIKQQFDWMCFTGTRFSILDEIGNLIFVVRTKKCARQATFNVSYNFY